MRKLVSILLLSVLVCVSCSDDDPTGQDPGRNPGPTPDPGPGKENPYKTGKDLSKSTSVQWDNELVNNDYFMLGYGYDATGNYAHPASVKNRVIDMEKLAVDDWNITIMRASSSSAELLLEGTQKECITYLAKKAGFSQQEISKYKNLFKEKFTSFSNDTSFPDLNYQYYGISSMPTLYHAYFMFNDRFFTKGDYLDEGFKSDLANLSSEEIIAKYGTHVLKGILLGGRIDYLYRYASASSSATNDTYWWFLYNLDEYFQFPSGTSPKKPEGESPLKENIYVEAILGARTNPNAWMIDITNGGKSVTYNGRTDITEDNITLINFRNDDGLIPIYKFVSDPVKKEEVQKAFEKYLSE